MTLSRRDLLALGGMTLAGTTLNVSGSLVLTGGTAHLPGIAGELATFDGSPLTAAVLRGLLETSTTERAEVLNAIADAVEKNQDMLAVAESWENGKPVRETLAADIPLVVDHFRYFAAAARAEVHRLGIAIRVGVHTGEIELRGESVMLGYHKAPQLTARTLSAEGWLATGDLGYRDEDGFYFITGRLKELIIKGGENIAPREIDEALLKHPAVLEAAAVGIPDERYGQEILACVVLKAGMQCSEEALRAHCIRELGPYKTPKILRFVDDLPKGASGKVQRLKLLEVT